MTWWLWLTLSWIVVAPASAWLIGKVIKEGEREENGWILRGNLYTATNVPPPVPVASPWLPPTDYED